VERALDLAALTKALGDHRHLLLPGLLPTPVELQALMAEMEARLILKQPRTPEEGYERVGTSTQLHHPTRRSMPMGPSGSGGHFRSVRTFLTLH
jgi:hypothetical protein